MNELQEELLLLEQTVHAMLMIAPMAFPFTDRCDRIMARIHELRKRLGIPEPKWWQFWKF